ncbi:AraC family transcriptional regulator [Paenibacillus graminis]|uniref:AraC family transcriptional regulator n=1 Tax=Paenibacillus graminis TaxID=189425 RepID=UPI002DBE5193|nr:AraC family transcriptional regulator [Paenibacillus graminis]MEC0169615.1 AraC family transcriptional regulator [Paenibacillus graminis]
MIPEHYDFYAGFNLLPEEQDLAVLFSGEGKPFPGHKIGPSVHDYYLIHTVLAGEGSFQSSTVTQQCQKGDTFVIFPGSLFSYQADVQNPWYYAWVALQGTGVSGLLSDIGITKERPLLHTENISELHRLYERTRLCFKQSAYPRLESLEASGWTRLLLHHFGQDNLALLPARPKELPEIIDRQIDQAIRWISLQFHQQISIDHMAATLGYHRAHLSKAFKQKTGLSPKQYLLKMRMDKAKSLLSGTLTIDQVASSVGFNDALYFSRQFRKFSGMSPSEYRSLLRQE